MHPFFLRIFFVWVAQPPQENIDASTNFTEQVVRKHPTSLTWTTQRPVLRVRCGGREENRKPLGECWIFQYPHQSKGRDAIWIDVSSLLSNFWYVFDGSEFRSSFAVKKSKDGKSINKPNQERWAVIEGWSLVLQCAVYFGYRNLVLFRRPFPLLDHVRTIEHGEDLKNPVIANPIQFTSTSKKDSKDIKNIRSTTPDKQTVTLVPCENSSKVSACVKVVSRLRERVGTGSSGYSGVFFYGWKWTEMGNPPSFFDL